MLLGRSEEWYDHFKPEVFKAMIKTIQVKGFDPKYFYK